MIIYIVHDKNVKASIRLKLLEEITTDPNQKVLGHINTEEKSVQLLSNTLDFNDVQAIADRAGMIADMLR